MLSVPLNIVMILLILLTTAWVYYNTIITKKWRNKAPGEAQSWYGGVFYYNPDDSRIMLPKRTGLGWTVNFAQPGSIVFVMALLGLILYMLLK